MLLTTFCAALLIGTPAQTVNGVKPVMDGMIPFAKAYAKYVSDVPPSQDKPDYFAYAFFVNKGKTLAALTNTKYTAAHVGVCGTMLTVFDEKLGTTIKTTSDRIVKGSKDFDSFTKEETDAIQKLIAESPISPFKRGVTKQANWEYFAGAQLGLLAAYTTAWHISPKEPMLLKWISESVTGLPEHGASADGAGRKELADALKGFSKLAGKTMDEAGMKEVGLQIEAALKAATLEKYRW